MRQSGKVVIVSQHYPPDLSTTAAIMAELAEHLAAERRVLVLSGAPGSRRIGGCPSQPTIIEIKNRIPAKANLIRRATTELLFTIRAFIMVLTKTQRADVVLTVTAPFTLPYAVVAAAKLKGARSVLIMHDLFPEVLVVAGLLRPGSLITRAIRQINQCMFRLLNAVIAIGRDTEKLLWGYRGLARNKVHLIPNWPTLQPAIRPIDSKNPYRPHAAHFVVGLSGNLGFTHDPLVVFEAARWLRNEPGVHFLLSGWGVGFERLKQLQSDATLPNVTLIDRVPAENLERFLAAANVWLIPYRKNVAGLSVPSRFYNLLAVGRPVILISEPDAEAALTVKEESVGWVVMPDRVDELVDAIRAASVSSDTQIAERAVLVAKNFSLDRAMADYAQLIDELLLDSKPKERLS
jgi:glycosyltransferase involved in cell wall biosynthesis